MRQRENELALVTGASSGIGRELARVLASQGVNLVITARREERLATLRDELQRAHDVKVDILPHDLDRPDGAALLYDVVRAGGHEITLLINNAGFGHFGDTADVDMAKIESQLQVNVDTLTRLTRLFAADMRKRGHGHLLNLSSFAALTPIPGYAVYSGAKAYVIGFSQALRHELKGSGVSVSVLCPGFTTTEFHKVSDHRKTRLMRTTSMTAEKVAAAGIAGMWRGKFLIVPGWWYKLNTLTARMLPRSWSSALSATIVGD